MQSTIEYIFEKISLKNPMHGKKIRKNVKKFDEGYFNHAQSFFERYESLLKNDNKSIDYSIDCYLQMLADVNYESVQFVQTGEYSSKSFEEVNKRVYDNPLVMEYYMHGLLLSQFLWAHHYDILLWFNKIITANKSAIRNYLEVGGGHGLYVSNAIEIIGDKAKFNVVDISQSSLSIAQKMINNDKVTYILTDVYEFNPPQTYDFITMGEVLEHVEDPVRLLRKLHSLLSDTGKLLITTPTNAPAIDHIFLFKDAEHIRSIIKDAGFNVEDEICIYSEDVPPEIIEKYKISMMYGGLLVKQKK